MKKFCTIFAFFFCAQVLQAQVTNTASKTVKVYPNPASAYLNIDFTQSDLSNCSLKVFNFIGKKVFEENMLRPRIVINVSDYFRGVYTYQFYDRNGFVLASGKFQVSH